MRDMLSQNDMKSHQLQAYISVQTGDFKLILW